MPRTTARGVVLWIISGLAAFSFVTIGAEKFVSAFWYSAFHRWGYSDTFRMAIGVLEVTGGLLLVVPPLTVYGALLIDVIMLGAIGTLVRFHEHLFAPSFWLVTISLIGYARHSQARRRRQGEIPGPMNTV